MVKIYNSVGTMSGTSFDGIDVSLAKTDGKDIFENTLNLYHKFDDKLKTNLKKLKKEINNYQDLIKIKSTKLFLDIENQITDLHISLIKKIILQSKDQIDLIGFHGITLYHDAANKFTFQLGNIEKFSRELKITTVYNFRQNDLDHGGVGAPLVPIFHKLILNILNKNDHDFNGIVNIGGISNISYLKNNILFATDIGPGNCLIDQWCKFFFNVDYDKDGLLTSKEKFDLNIANNFIDRFNFSKNISYDFSDFSISEFRGMEKHIGLSTLTYITANLILNFLSEKKIEKVLIAGGGRKNKTIMNFLKNKASDIDKYNFHGDFIESQAFAYLAVRSMERMPITFPETTGVTKPLSGGIFKKV